MGLEEALTYVVAIAVPVWLVVEQVMIRRRSANAQSLKAVPTQARPESVSPRTSRAAELPHKAA